ncbi:MAG: hypothetical protein JSV00_03495 [bacterium]|nr:MAG: hypothetical protein JSV00_03495 [bacterium]
MTQRTTTLPSTGVGKAPWKIVFPVVMLFFTATGCATLQSRQVPPVAEDREPLETRITQLERENSLLREQIENLKKTSGQEVEVLTRRLEKTQKTLDDTIREVVRARSRIQGMASAAEASAMFAEARVHLDRMREKAFNEQALGDFEIASAYLLSGKKEMESGNPGGAAFLFEIVSSIYAEFRNSNPDRVVVSVDSATLLKAPSSTSQKVGVLHRGEAATGLKILNEWMQIRTPSGQQGWLLRRHLH